MNEEFRLPKWLLYLGEICLGVCFAMLIGSVVLVCGATNNTELTRGAFITVFSIAMGFLFVGLILAERYERLQFQDGTLTVRSIWKTQTILLAEVVEINWWSSAEIVLKTPSEKIRIGLVGYASEARCRIAALIQWHCARASSKNWQRFCAFVALRTKRSSAATVDANEMQISRSRWAWYFIPGIVLSEIVGFIAKQISEESRPYWPLVMPVDLLRLFRTVRLTILDGSRGANRCRKRSL